MVPVVVTGHTLRAAKTTICPVTSHYSRVCSDDYYFKYLRRATPKPYGYGRYIRLHGGEVRFGPQVFTGVVDSLNHYGDTL